MRAGYYSWPGDISRPGSSDSKIYRRRQRGSSHEASYYDVDSGHPYVLAQPLCNGATGIFLALAEV